MLSLPQQQFINATLAGQSIEKAAEIAGITKMTGYRWIKLPDVQQALAGEIEKRAETARDVINRVYAKMLEASCTTVTQIMLDAEIPAASRLKAAAMIQDRLAPASADVVSAIQPEQNAGIDWGIFTSEELSIILPVFQQAEKRAAGVIDLRKEA